MRMLRLLFNLEFKIHAGWNDDELYTCLHSFAIVIYREGNRNNEFVKAYNSVSVWMSVYVCTIKIIYILLLNEGENLIIISEYMCLFRTLF